MGVQEMKEQSGWVSREKSGWVSRVGVFPRKTRITAMNQAWHSRDWARWPLLSETLVGNESTKMYKSFGIFHPGM